MFQDYQDKEAFKLGKSSPQDNTTHFHHYGVLQSNAMSLPETKRSSDTAVIIDNDITPPVELLINPIKYRTEIFSAVRISHEKEILHRYCCYDTRRDRSRLPIETSRQYLDFTQSLEIDVTICKTGHRF